MSAVLWESKDRRRLYDIEQIYAHQQARRYGLQVNQIEADPEWLGMQLSLTDWLEQNDRESVSSDNLRYVGWMPVYFKDSDGSISTTPCANAGITAGIAYPGTNFYQGDNVLEVTTGGCITRIEVNPNISTQGGFNYVHTQTIPQTTWVVNHGLGYIPNMYMVNDQGVVISGIVHVVDSNILHIIFSVPVSGTAYLS